MQSKMVLHACLCVAAAHISFFFFFLYFLRFMVVSLRVGKKKCQKRTSALDDLPRDCTTVFTSLTRFFFFFVTVDRYHLYVYTPVCDTSTGLRRTRDSVGFCT